MAAKKREGKSGPIGLSEMIAELRSELEQAMAEGKGKALRFDLNAIELEVKVAVARELKGTAKAGVKFWVFSGVEASGSASKKKETLQTLKLKMTPVAPEGSPEPARAGKVLLSSKG